MFLLGVLCTVYLVFGNYLIVGCLHFLGRLYTYREIHENDREMRKMKVYSVVFRVIFFAFCASSFAFCILRQDKHSCENSKDFVVYFFMALIEREIHMKCEKCMVTVTYFMVCFAKTFAKCKIRKLYSQPYRTTQNTLYGQCSSVSHNVQRERSN